MGAPQRKEKPIFNPSVRATLTVEVRCRGQEMRTYEIDALGQPDVAEFFAKVFSSSSPGQELPDSLEAKRDFLEKSGLFISPQDIPKSVEPNIVLTEDLLPLIPGSHRSAAQAALSEQKLILNPHIKFQPGPSRPDGCLGLPPESDFPHHYPLVWVPDAGTRLWSPFQVDSDRFEQLRKLEQDPSLIARLDPKDAELFILGRILVTKDHAQARSLYWDKGLEECVQGIETNQFCVVRSLLPPLALATLKRHYSSLHREGYLTVDRQQVHDMRYIKHNEELSRFVHRQTGSVIRRVTQESVIPSYCFLSAYREGAELPKHVDRSQCAWNASLLVDWDADSTALSWPIYLEALGKTHEVILTPGDAVVYKGDRVPHWRPPMKAGQRQSLLLLHYVPMEFTGSLD